MHGHAGEHVQAGQEHLGQGRETGGARDVGGRKDWNYPFTHHQCCPCVNVSKLKQHSAEEENNPKERFIYLFPDYCQNKPISSEASTKNSDNDNRSASPDTV